MPQLRRLNRFRRNEPCPCGSGQKFKRCCGGTAPPAPGRQLGGVTYIDSGEDAIRWVICDEAGTSFFSDKDNRIIVFTDKATAIAVASMTEFSNQDAGEINVAGVGSSKFAQLCETLPYTEVDTIETAVALVQERIETKLAELVDKEENSGQEDHEVHAQEGCKKGCDKEACGGQGCNRQAADEG